LSGTAALCVLISFASTCLYEAGFSTSARQIEVSKYTEKRNYEFPGLPMSGNSR